MKKEEETLQIIEGTCKEVTIDIDVLKSISTKKLKDMLKMSESMYEKYLVSKEKNAEVRAEAWKISMDNFREELNKRAS